MTEEGLGFLLTFAVFLGFGFAPKFRSTLLYGVTFAVAAYLLITGWLFEFDWFPWGFLPTQSPLSNAYLAIFIWTPLFPIAALISGLVLLNRKTKEDAS